MIHGVTLLTIALMAGVTFAIRIGGYLALRDRELGPHATAVMEAAPGCVLVALVTPGLVSGRLADTLALGITALAAARLPMLPTVLIGIAAAGGLRHLLG